MDETAIRQYVLDTFAGVEVPPPPPAKMRMWPHRELAGIAVNHVIEEHERPDEPPADRRQHTTHREAAEVTRSCFDEALDHPILALRVISPIRPVWKSRNASCGPASIPSLSS